MMSREERLKTLSEAKQIGSVKFLSADQFNEYLENAIEQFTETVKKVEEALADGVDIRTMDLAKELESLKGIIESNENLAAAVKDIHIPSEIKLEASALIDRLEKIKLQPVIVKNEDPVANYKHSDSDDSEDSNIAYHGFISPTGAFYIMEHIQNKNGSVSRYYFRPKGYDLAWKARKALGYKLFNEAILDG